MTVAELKKALEPFSDSTEVLLDIPGIDEYVDFTGFGKTGDGELVLVSEEPDWSEGEEEDEDEPE